MRIVLLSSWLLVGLAALTATVAARWMVVEWKWAHRPRPGRRRWRWRSVATLACICLSVTSAVEALNLKYSYLDDPLSLVGSVSPDLRTAPLASARLAAAVGSTPARGFVQEVHFGGGRSGLGRRPVYVYLPPQYFDPSWSSVRFGVLYMLPGFPGTVADWLRSGHVERAMDHLLGQGQIHPFIVVMPEFNADVFHDSECQNVPRGPQVQTYLTVDVVRAVDARYRTVAERRGRAIGGISTGAYCAINLALRHQDVYSAFISHSGFAEPDVNPFTYDLFGGDPIKRRANTPADYLPALRVNRQFSAYLDVGTSDSESRRDSQLVANALRAKKMAIEFQILPNGPHTWATWRRGLYGSLPWLSSWFAHQGVAPSPGHSRAVPGRAPPPIIPVAHRAVFPATVAVARRSPAVPVRRYLRYAPS